MSAWIFWVSFVGAAFSYFLYPLILAMLPARQRFQIPDSLDDEHLPHLTLIVTVHNEARRIGSKLADVAALDYPRDRLEILIASDVSTDETDDIIRTAGHPVRLVRADERRGKEYAQWCAIREARGELLVFSDVATRMPADSLRNLARCFVDPNVGAVSSEDRFISKDGSIVGEGLYVRYEMWLRRLESGRAGLVGLSGSFFAARRHVCESWDTAAPSDFTVAFNCARLGHVAITSRDVVGIYSDVSDPQSEYRRKLRTVMRGITALVRHPYVLNPFRFGLFSFQVLGHKLMRWLVPWFLLVLFGTSVLLVLTTPAWIYSAALAAQVVFYTLVVLGACSTWLRSRAPIRIPYFFVEVNLAIAHATLLYLGGTRMTVWSPSRR